MKKIIIMGASSGLGLAMAEAFASRGVKVGAAARRLDSLEKLKKRYPGMVETASIDVTKPDATKRLEKLVETMGGLDLYIHAAGIGYENRTLEPERDLQIIETDAVALARMVGWVYRYMRDGHRKGQIAAITSVAGTKGIGPMAAYSASKAFGQVYLSALRQLARRDHAQVTITDIRPGWTRTPMLDTPAHFPLEMAPGKVVAKTLRAIEQHRSIATIDCRWKALVAAWRLLPDWLWSRIDPSMAMPSQKQ